jgi:hypothetical protein
MQIIHNLAVTNRKYIWFRYMLNYSHPVYVFIYLIAHVILENGGIIYNIITMPVEIVNNRQI